MHISGRPQENPGGAFGAHIDTVKSQYSGVAQSMSLAQGGGSACAPQNQPSEQTHVTAA
jgi:hypothetical protein